MPPPLKRLVWLAFSVLKNKSFLKKVLFFSFCPMGRTPSALIPSLGGALAPQCLQPETWDRPGAWLPPPLKTGESCTNETCNDLHQWKTTGKGGRRLPAVQVRTYWDLPSNGTNEYQLQTLNNRCVMRMKHRDSPNATMTGFSLGACPTVLHNASVPHAIDWKRGGTRGSAAPTSVRCRFSGSNPSVVLLAADSPIRQQASANSHCHPLQHVLLAAHPIPGKELTSRPWHSSTFHAPRSSVPTTSSP